MQTDDPATAEPTETGAVDEGRHGWRPATAATVLAVLAVAAWSNPFLAGTVLVLLVVIAVHELGHLLVARRAGMDCPEYMVGFGPTVWSARRGATTWGLKAVPLGGYVRITGMSPAEPVDPALESSTYRSAPWRWKVAVSVAGPLSNLLLAVVLVTVVLAGFGRSVTPRDAVVGEVARYLTDGSRSPASVAGVRAGDTVVSFAGRSAGTWSQLVEAVEAGGGRRGTLVVRRDGELVRLQVRPARTGGRWVLGVQHEAVRRRVPLARAVPESVGVVAGGAKVALGSITSTLGRVDRYLGTVATGGEVPQEKRFLSPVGAAEVARSAARDGVPELLGLAALVNVMLGVFNLLPVPPLDGGHVLVATVESLASVVRRRKVVVPARVLLPVTYAVWGLLLLVGLSSVWMDLVDPVRL